AAAVVASVALATTGLATAQTSTSPRSTMPSTSSPSSTSPGVTSPSTGAATTHSSAANTDASMDAQSPETIKQAQQQLKSQGLYNGAIDGQMGPETASALSKFQEKNGLPANSELDQQTMAKLMGNGSTSPPASMNPSMTPSTGSSSSTNPGAGGGTGSSTGTHGTGSTTR